MRFNALIAATGTTAAVFAVLGYGFSSEVHLCTTQKNNLHAQKNLSYKKGLN